ncbi:hypothetical protein CRM90_03310 [Mycobacterium sp. ENV421]|uniref:hypothetical protein n=1 Tax=unclassified Mycobacterium TaxID=2642494 RepID=UPI000C9BB232|nr:hypothetical protein [Mycobacterium sp. ENV421]PND59185.1 hypothetical protein CRM90_03310 [Mycobacterium sp. ENV421]
MNSPSVSARLAAVVGGAALVAMASFVASCSKNENPAPAPSVSTTTSSTSPSPSATPTEKGLNPSNPNKFSPTVIAPPAPTDSGGNHHHGLNGIG